MSCSRARSGTGASRRPGPASPWCGSWAYAARAKASFASRSMPSTSTASCPARDAGSTTRNPSWRIIAAARFRDTLAGRKEEVWLTPMIAADAADFGRPDLAHRLLRGGLPPFFLADRLPEREFQEWVDAYWAKDILELFRLERRHAFQRLL